MTQYEACGRHCLVVKRLSVDKAIRIFSNQFSLSLNLGLFSLDWQLIYQVLWLEQHAISDNWRCTGTALGDLPCPCLVQARGQRLGATQRKWVAPVVGHSSGSNLWMAFQSFSIIVGAICFAKLRFFCLKSFQGEVDLSDAVPLSPFFS